MNKAEYQKIVKKHEVKNNRVKNALMAFLVGGLVGILANFFYDISLNWIGLEKTDAGILSTLGIIFITTVLTATSLYNKVARVAGAGLFIPTSGFANSVVSSSIDAKFEGPVYGVGSRMFYLAGSVITYGFVSAFLYALIRLLLSLVGVPLV